MLFPRIGQMSRSSRCFREQERCGRLGPGLVGRCEGNWGMAMYSNNLTQVTTFSHFKKWPRIQKVKSIRSELVACVFDSTGGLFLSIKSDWSLSNT